jgi:LysR family glycine cleavage system transcriptional activator
MPNLTQLRAFEAAARNLSVSKAADDLNVTHAAVSQQLRALEEWLGLSVLRRSGRSIVLTDAGQRYYAAVRDAFDLVERETVSLRRADVDRPLHVATTSAFASRWLVPRLPRFQARAPQIQLRLNPTSALTDFEREDVDLGIRHGEGNWPGLTADPLVGGRLVPLCSPSYLKNSPRLETPQDLADHFLIHDSEYAEWELWLRGAGADAVDARRGTIFSLTTLSYQAAVDGQGVILGLAQLVSDDLAAGRLVIPFEPPPENRKAAYYIIHRARIPLRAAAETFRQWLIDEAESDRESASNEGE